ncbi:unnamed protein product [Polarella glacialis]|uniref:Uncharacterized protein n=1 Tax=Polarella glacialis TaxID=89957 RepID=A0A813HIZ5_POLGL|nr:unnamed protein product [Polarella glacialis]
MFQGILGLPQVSYSTHSSEPNEPPVFLPAKFSVKLGAGVNSSAPVLYMASSAADLLGRFCYHGLVSPVIDEPSACSGTLGSDLSNGSVSQFAGMLPIARAAAASSAFVGSALLYGELADEVQTLLHAGATPWISSASHGRAFDTAENAVGRLRGFGGVNRDSIHELASLAVHGVIDGGFTDGTGISQAVAAGADNILVVLNSGSTNDPAYVEMLFRGGPPPVNPQVSKELFPVFETPAASTVRWAFEFFHKLRIPPTSQYLKVLAVGRIECRTADNAYFGVQRGRKVVLNIVNMGSDLDIGLFVNFHHYDTLAQEIALTIVDAANARFVQDVFLPMVLGKKANLSAAVPIVV